ncbi:hypothetical protein JCM10296v2_002075 [Rhodotorula toruloides]
MPSSGLSLPGTDFASPEALRLAVHKGCLEKGYELAVLHGGGVCGELRCRVAAKGGGACAFRLLYSGNGTQVHVTQIHEEHTCSSEAGKRRRPAAQAWARSKIVQLEATLKQPASSQAARSSKRPQTPDDDITDSSSGSEAEGHAQAPRRSLRSRVQVDYYKPNRSRDSRSDEDGDEDEQSSEDEAEQSREVPAASIAAKRPTFAWSPISEVREEARRVAKTARLGAPTVGASPPRATCSYNFMLSQLRRASPCIVVTLKKMARQSPSVAVRVAVRASTRLVPGAPASEAHGSYRLSKVVLGHSHDLAPPNDIDEREPEATPNVASTSASTPLAGPSNSQAANSFFSPLPRPPPQHSRFHFYTAQPQIQPAPARLPALAFLADLKALISLLIPDFPPASTSRLASKLVGAGSRSVSDLSAFLFFEGDSVLPDFLEDLAHREGDEVADDAFLFLQLMRAYSLDDA